MIFESLSDKHTDLLLQFEIENKEWFETLISPRESDFYTTLGVQNHISKSIEDAKNGKSYSGVLIEDGKIIARGNLKDICVSESIASVGYRVAKNSTGKGCASYCLSELIEKANVIYNIAEIEAQVLDNNPASKAVLIKFGFNPCEHIDNFFKLNGMNLGCTTYKYLAK